MPKRPSPPSHPRREHPRTTLWRAEAARIKNLAAGYQHLEMLTAVGILVLESGLPFEEWCTANAAGKAARARGAADRDQGSIFDQVLRDARLLSKEEKPNLSEVKRVLIQLRGLADYVGLLTNPNAKVLSHGLGPSTSEEERRWATSTRRNLLKAHNILLRRSGVDVADFEKKDLPGAKPAPLTKEKVRACYEGHSHRVDGVLSAIGSKSARRIREGLLQEYTGEEAAAVPSLRDLKNRRFRPSYIKAAITGYFVGQTLSPPRRLSARWVQDFLKLPRH